MKTATNSKATAKNRISEIRIEIPEIEIKEMTITVRGTSELITHQFGEKARKKIKSKQAQEPTKARAKRDPKAEYLASCYVMPSSKYKAGHKKCKYGVPASAFKNAMVAACRVTGAQMTVTKIAFHVSADESNLVNLSFKKMEMREDVVRLAGPSRPADLRYRPEFSGWSCKLRIRYNSRAITAAQLVNLLNNAGFGVGIGEWRPERNGSFGTFEVKA